jgi:hypothetical protein
MHHSYFFVETIGFSIENDVLQSASSLEVGVLVVSVWLGLVGEAVCVTFR